MSTEYDIVNAIIAINPNAKVVVENDNIEKIKWCNGTEVISNSDILAKQTQLKTAYDNAKYQRDRATEYPKIADQLDDLYHNGIDGWKATIKKVKDKYPKE